MLFWCSGVLLVLEAARVIEARLRLVAQGKCTPDEFMLMVAEKLDAMADAQAIVTSGGHPKLVLDNYRKIVAANAARLSRS
jgi:hypothetical protein